MLLVAKGWLAGNEQFNTALRIARRPMRLAVLISPTAIVSPSSYSSLAYFGVVAAKQGIDIQPISAQSLDELSGFDALFIRMTTEVGGDAHRFSLRAAKLGLPVIDDPLSIVRGSSKVVQNKLLTAHNVPIPRTSVVGSVSEVRGVVTALGLPTVFKIANGCFSRGVEKGGTLAECEEIAARLLFFGTPILAQEFTPTAFDWRIGVLDGAPIFACKYHMVSGHWQVVARGKRGSLINGDVEAVPLAEAPSYVTRLAVEAAGCIGRGLYGIDIKETASGPVVVEVNDNPDMDCDAETTANPEAWEALAGWFASAMASRPSYSAARAIA